MKTKDQIISDAIGAFFSVVSSNYPEVNTGDLSPLQLATFETACNSVLNSWLENNPPRLNPATASTLREISNEIPLQDAISFLNQIDIDYTGLNDLDVIALYLEKREKCETCPDCEGTGRDNRDERRPCDNCDGLGYKFDEA